MFNFGIKKVDKLLLKSFIVTFISLLILVLFVLVTHSFFLMLNSFVGKGLGFFVYAKLLYYIGISLFPQAFPIAVLVSSLIVFGNFSESFELTAMRSVGMSLQRMLRFPFMFILLLSIALFYFKDYVHPTTKHKIFALGDDIIKKRSALFIQEGVFCNNIPDYGIHVDKKLNDNGEMQGIVVYDHTKSYGNVAITIAEKGRLHTTLDENYLVMELSNGHNYVEALPNNKNSFSDDKKTFYRNNFTSQTIKISLDTLKLGNTKEQYVYEPRTRTHPQLKAMIEKNRQRVMDQANYIQDLLAQQALHYMPPPVTHNANLSDLKKQEEVTQDLPSIDETDFMSFRERLVKKEMVSNTDQKDNPYFTEQVVNHSLYAIDKIKKSLLEQKHYETKIAEYLHCALFEKEHRLAIAIQCLIMFLLAAPLGCVIRRGGFGVSVAISSFFGLLEYILSLIGRDWAYEGTISPLLGAWLANLILFPFCCFFLAKAQLGRGLSLLSGWHTCTARIKKMIGIRRNTTSHIGH